MGAVPQEASLCHHLKPESLIRGKALFPRLIIDDDKADGPFLSSQTDQDPHLHSINLQIISSGRTVLDDWEVVLLQNQFPEELVESWTNGWTNPLVESRIYRIFQSIFKQNPAPDSPAAHIALDPANQNEIPVLAPTFYWRKSRRLIQLRCPLTLGPLVTCRDDALLKSHGLPPFHSSMHRFLYSPQAQKENLPAAFYSASIVADSDIVYPPEKLLADQIKLLTKARTDQGLDQTLKEQVLADFSSDEFEPLVEDLKILNLHESPVLLRHKTGINILDAARRLSLPPLAQEQGGKQENCRLFSSDGSGMDALEVLRLKLTLGLQAVTDVRTYYQTFSGPHLGLGPSAFKVRIGGIVPGLPSFWNQQAGLTGLPAGALVPDTPELELHRILLEREPVFLPEWARNELFWKTREGQLVIRKIQNKESKPKILAELKDEGITWPKLSARDFLRIALPVKQTKEPLEIWANVISDPSGSAGDLALQFNIAPDHIPRFEQLQGVIPQKIRYTILPCLQAPVDLYSLGLLLISILVTHDQQSVSAVAESLIKACRILEDKSGSNEKNLKLHLAKKAATWLSESREAVVFSKDHLFSDPQDRRQGRPNAVPAELWEEALILGLRMITQAPEFGICQDRGDFDQSNPASVFEPVLAQLEILLTKIDALLFGQHVHNREVRHAVGAFINK